MEESPLGVTALCVSLNPSGPGQPLPLTPTPPSSHPFFTILFPYFPYLLPQLLYLNWHLRNGKKKRSLLKPCSDHHCSLVPVFLLAGHQTFKKKHINLWTHTCKPLLWLSGPPFVPSGPQADDGCDGEGPCGSWEPEPSWWLIHYSRVQLSFKDPKMPQSRAVLNINTIIMMDVAAEALLDLQVSTLLLAVQNLAFVNLAGDLTQDWKTIIILN